MPNIIRFLALIVFSFWTTPASAISILSCDSIFQQIPSESNIIETLRRVDSIVNTEAYQTYQKLSSESIEYIRTASGNQQLTPKQAQQLYNNNLLLLAFRANKKANDLVLQSLLKDSQEIEAEVQQISKELNERSSIQTPLDGVKYKSALKEAIVNTRVNSLSRDEIAKIVQIYSLRNEQLANPQKRKAIEVTIQSIEEDLRPEIRLRLDIERRSKTDSCCGAACLFCPLSMGLKKALSYEGLGDVSAHLTKIPGSSPPAELILFTLTDQLNYLLPAVNW